MLLFNQDPHLTATGDSTNDIANLLGMLDPWYERNTLSLMNLPANVVCQVQLESNFYTAKTETHPSLVLSVATTLLSCR